MTTKYTYEDPGDPSDFAPDFQKQPEPYGHPIAEVLACFDKLPAGSHIVDIAGGYGRYAIPLAARGHLVTIVDIHDESLREAERRAASLHNAAVGGIHTVKADVLREDLPELTDVDAVMCFGFLHHLTNEAVQAIFTRMTTVLRPGGLSVIEFSTNKDRRFPSGEPILVDGVKEHNLSLEEGMEFMHQLYNEEQFVNSKFDVVKLYERQVDFWYDADMIVAQGTKK